LELEFNPPRLRRAEIKPLTVIVAPEITGGLVVTSDFGWPGGPP
jgi:hypothetical protein